MSHLSSLFLNPYVLRIQDAKVCLQPTIYVAGCTWQEICNSIGSDLMRVIRSNDCSAWLHNHPVAITEPGEPYTENSDHNVLKMIFASMKISLQGSVITESWVL